MSRIEPNRPGYTGFDCGGINVPDIEPIDCNSNRYKKLPMAFYGGITYISWQSLDAVATSPRLNAIRQMCDMDYDPFLGFCMDLYQAFIDVNMDHVLADDCYEPSDIYWPGFLNPYPKAKFGGIDCATRE